MNQTATTEFVYDGAGNQVKIIDPAGETSNFYTYLNRLAEVRLPTETFREGDNLVQVRPTVKYEYNDLGQKTAES